MCLRHSDTARGVPRPGLDQTATRKVLLPRVEISAPDSRRSRRPRERAGRFRIRFSRRCQPAVLDGDRVALLAVFLRRSLSDAGRGLAAVVDDGGRRLFLDLVHRFDPDHRAGEVLALAARPLLARADQRSSSPSPSSGCCGRTVHRRPPAGAWTDGKTVRPAFPVLSFQPLDPRKLGVRRIPDLVHVVARLFVDRIRRTRVALQGGGGDQRGGRAGQERDRPKPGIRAVRDVSGLGWPSPHSGSSSRRSQSRAAFLPRHFCATFFCRAGAHLAGLYRSAGFDLRRQAFQWAVDVAGASGMRRRPPRPNSIAHSTNSWLLVDRVPRPARPPR